MASSKTDLLDDVREFTGYDEYVLDSSELRTCLDVAQRHIATRKSLDASEAPWYTNDELEDALFWFTSFLTKVATGELDAPGGSVENVEIEMFSASDSEWYRRAEQAVRAVSLDTGSSSGSVGSVTREDRTYGGGDSLI